MEQMIIIMPVVSSKYSMQRAHEYLAEIDETAVSLTLL
jgi:hypothetical protein